MDVKFDFNDVLLQPAIYSEVESRKTINVLDENNKLPLMTAPMDTVINEKNYELFDKLGYQLVFPRTLRFSRIRDIDPNWEYYFENCFFSIGLDEFKDMVKSSHKKSCEIVNLPLPKKILVDIANGHMSILKELAIKFKELYPDKILMLGNIANPKTYKYFAETGCVDYLRVGIGNGSGCLTTKSTAIGYPMASLINEIYQEKQEFIKNNPDKKAPYIIADGGMKDYADIIKSLALGSDVVMVGSLLNKSIESAGGNYWMNIKIPQKIAEWLFKRKYTVKKYFRGMSTKEAQLAMGKDKNKLTTSEGVVRKRKVEYSIVGWTNNLIDYLKSSMSYSNNTNLSEFIGKAEWIKITTNAYNRFNK